MLSESLLFKMILFLYFKICLKHILKTVYLLNKNNYFIYENKQKIVRSTNFAKVIVLNKY